MANQRRLADNINRYEAGHTGVPRKGSALLQGIAICGRCGRRMSLRYTGPNGDYPVYCCRVDRDQRGGALCQEVRALPVDALVERVLLDALAPDQIAIAIAAMGQLEEESRQLERQWTLRRERARYEAERARRQYDAVEPENRLVARSLERAWEEKLRAVEAIEQEYARWRSEEPLVIGAADRAELQAWVRTCRGFGTPTPRRQPTESAFCALSCAKSCSIKSGRKVRYGSRLSGKPAPPASTACSGAFTPTATTSILNGCGSGLRSSMAPARWTRRSPQYSTEKASSPPAAVHSKARMSGCCVPAGRSRPSRSMASARIRRAGPTAASRFRAWRRRSGSRHKPCSTILRVATVAGHQLTKGQPWQIELSDEQIDRLRARVRRTKRSRKEAS